MEQWDAVIMGNDELLERNICQGNRLKCQNWNRKKTGDSKRNVISVYHGSAKNNLRIRKLIEVIASKFYSSTPEVNLNYAGRFLRLNIQRKGGVLFMCVYIAEHCI